MLSAHEQQSEVARLLAQINSEYTAAIHGVSGLALGTARHTFITHRMEQMGKLHLQLKDIVGEDEAIRLAAESIEALPDRVAVQ